MKRIIFILLIVSPLLSKKSLILQDPLVDGRYGFFCPDSTFCTAIDFSGPEDIIILNTYDKGKNWEEKIRFDKSKIEPDPIPFSGLRLGYFLDSNHYYFLDSYQKGTLFFTEDGFKTFKTVKIPFKNSIQDFIMIDNKTGFIINWDYIFYTRDSWETWDTINFESFANHQKIIQRTDSTLLISCVQNIPDLGLEYFYSILEVNINTLEYELLETFPSFSNDLSPYIHYLHFEDENIGFMGGGTSKWCQPLYGYNI